MNYVAYEIYKNKYYEAQLKYNEILSEKELLFNTTQPRASKTDTDKQGGKKDNIFDSYLIAKEQRQIDKRLKEVKSILRDRERLLKLKEEELINSNNLYDRIYKYKYMEKMKVFKICKLIGYSEAQIYRILKTIKTNLKEQV